MSRLSDLEHRDREHVARIKRLRRERDERDRTIRELQQRLNTLAGAAGLLPTTYAAELATLATLAFDGPPSSSDMARALGGKPQSTGTRLPNPAYRSLLAELALLSRRAGRDHTGSPRGALSRAVDRAASEPKEQTAA